jgi:hypothetical protein
MKPAMTSRRMNNKPEIFAMVPDIIGDMIIIWGNEPLWRKTPFIRFSSLICSTHIASQGCDNSGGAGKSPQKRYENLFLEYFL